MDWKLLRIGVLLVLGMAGAALPGRAQSPGDWNRDALQLTRVELQALLLDYEQTAESSAYSASLRASARHEADLIRARLREGDFQVGDQVNIVVEGEDDLSNTFAVRPGPALTLPAVGNIPLEGVLRAELEQHLTTQLGRFIKNPVVHARSLFRITVAGAVGRPGFYPAAADIHLSDAIMLAGGPAPSAVITRIYIERGRERIWEGEALQQAITEGRTLDQLSLRAGDRIVVPAREPALGWQGILGLVTSAIAVVVTLTR